MKFRKKPVEIEARQTIDDLGVINSVRDWIASNGGRVAEPFLPDENCVLTILTLEGEMTVALGDWVIRGVQGEFYPCKPDIFAATYESVEEPA